MSRRTFWMLLAALTPVAVVLGGLGVLPLWRSSPPLALALTGLFASLVAIGIVLLAEPGQVAAGWAMIASAVLLIVSWGNEWRVGPLPLASEVVGNLWIIFGGWALYRYPNQRLSSGDRWMFRLLLGFFVITSWLGVFLSRPEWHSFPPGWWPAPIFADEALYHRVVRVVNVITVGLAALYVVRWIKRLRRASPAERRVKKPTGIASAAAACVGVSIPIARALRVGDAGMDVVFTAGTCAILAIPAAFLVAVLGRYLTRTALVSMLLNLASNSSTAQITNALREGLHDPQLQVLYWSDDLESYIDQDGQPVADPHERRQQLVVEIHASSRAPLAWIVADEAIGLDPDFVEAAAAVVGQKMENARLFETVQRQVLELRRQAARVAEATVTERQRIQRDLHDGVQGHLAALGPWLGAEISRTSDRATADQLKEMLAVVTDTAAALRAVSRGVRPAALNLGLPAAVRALCDEHRFDAIVELPDAELSHTVQEHVYLAISEALTNIVKHAQAATVKVHGRSEDGELIVVIADDGKGGATPGSGLGLSSMRDRIAALNGQLHISSPPGEGTRITMRIPCG